MKTPKTKATKTQEALQIPPIEIKQAKITLQGTTQLLVQKFTTKSRRQMADKHQKKATGAREVRNPHAEFEASMYKTKDGKHAIPAAGLKKCAVSACRWIEGISMTRALGSFFVIGNEEGLVPIKASEPVMQEDIVRVGNFGNKKPDLRYRARYDEWSVAFNVRYNAKIISPEQLLNLYENAGFHVGLHENRPEKSGNTYGMFQVARA